jgi:hypothetical protein
MKSGPFGVALLALLFLSLPAARAEARGLTYSAPAECPSEEAVVARLRERTGRESSARVLIRESGGRYAAIVSFAGEPDASRTMVGDTCEGVLEAALLVVAMNAPVEAADAPAPDPPAPAPTAPQAAPPPDHVVEARPEKTRAARFGVAIASTFAADALSEGRFTGSIGVSVALEWRRGVGDVSWLRPRLALGAGFPLGHTNITSPFAKSEYSRLMGFVEACPTSHEIGASIRLSFRPCGRVTGSLISLSTTSRVDPNTFGGGSFKSGTWSSAGALGRLRVAFDARGKPNEGVVGFVEIYGGVDVTLTADRFRMLGRSSIGPDATVASFGLAFGTVW